MAGFSWALCISDEVTASGHGAGRLSERCWNGLMDKSQITPGTEYAIREPVAAGVEFQRVKVLERVRGAKWRVEWIDPNPGLVDYIESRNIIVAWEERKEFLRDERNDAALQRVVQDSGFPGNQHPVAQAVHTVFAATGEPGMYVWYGVLNYPVDALQRVAHRAGTSVPTHPAGYIDRHGRGRLPWAVAMELAQAFSRNEPTTVLDLIDTEERQLAQEASAYNEEFMARALVESRASWALIRQWAGHDKAVALREERVRTLERLLSEVRWDLRRPNPDVERIATRIERVLR
jgi:hypothetical protein